MTRKFLDYVKSARLDAADTEIADRGKAESEQVELRMTTKGFPIIPKLVMEKDLRKNEWEKLLRAFLTQHYCELTLHLRSGGPTRHIFSSDLASGQKSKQVPFRALKTDTGIFILDKYLPSGIILQDPRNMHLDDIRKVLQHSYRLQAESGPESSFRFALFSGPKRKRLFANYPDNMNTEVAELEQRRSKKNKGKQREDQWQGLLRMDESEPPTEELGLLRMNESPTPTDDHIDTVGGSSNDHRTDPQTSSNGFVRIDMGQMLQLKDMGYKALGPVNGPNEGYPTYDVPKAVYQLLVSNRQSEGTSRQNEHVEPNETEMDRTDSAAIAIDPTLLGQLGTDPAPTDIVGQTNAIVNPPLNSLSSSDTNLPTLDTNIRPTTPPIAADVSTNTFKTPKKRLGKRAQKNLSPQTLHEKQNRNKKKKVTDDDLAALEAQNMVQSRSRRRNKPNRRK